jgi:hypothetical protein
MGGAGGWAPSWGSLYRFSGGTPNFSPDAGSIGVVSYWVKSLTEIRCSFMGAF